MTQVTAKASLKTERCALIATPACKARGGIIEIRAGYLAILDGKVGLCCEDCRAMLLKKIGGPERAGPEILAPAGQEEIPGEEF